ncbi:MULTISPECIES: hypothetical protein [unclassified Herbaspirillum]|uniref:hypothetical protein n=1 Tax=unclassified Herbaspirillum TaxID=2624150 RepID=UPI00107197F8|nr:MULTISPECIES: hypothetical protein [unclassified Herbaspirillum]TFI10990.1 hypothetical protein E4P32_05645 [Herbaspirillum sp. 3R11]TFI16897.1 hypothetical protein E4P31_05645 [Herbaspirillum sp. 3R-11]
MWRQKEAILLVFYTVIGGGYKKEGRAKRCTSEDCQNHLQSDERPTMDSFALLSILVWLLFAHLLQGRADDAAIMLQCQNWRGFQATRDIADSLQEVLVQATANWLEFPSDNFILRCCHG